MADKSPRQHMAKKSGKSLKEKRADKRANPTSATRWPPRCPDKKH